MIDVSPLLRSRRLWKEREAMCLKTLERALVLLQSRDDLPEAENDLNRRLYGCLLEANQELYPENDIPPGLECNSQPDLDDESRAKREQKRPDFQWMFIDRYELDALRSSKQFVVECKRLGKATSAKWLLNLNYTNNGIARFRDPIWGYARRFPSGAMVGYWQNMEGNDVLSEVNNESRKQTLPDLVLLDDSWNSSGLNVLEHMITREFEVSPFKLRHLWIDLRRAA